MRFHSKNSEWVIYERARDLHMKTHPVYGEEANERLTTGEKRLSLRKVGDFRHGSVIIRPYVARF